MNSIAIKKNPKEYNEFKVTMTLTQGKIESLKNALARYESPVARDLLNLLEDAMEKA